MISIILLRFPVFVLHSFGLHHNCLCVMDFFRPATGLQVSRLGRATSTNGRRGRRSEVCIYICVRFIRKWWNSRRFWLNPKSNSEKEREQQQWAKAKVPKFIEFKFTQIVLFFLLLCLMSWLSLLGAYFYFIEFMLRGQQKLCFMGIFVEHVVVWSTPVV